MINCQLKSFIDSHNSIINVGLSAAVTVSYYIQSLRFLWTLVGTVGGSDLHSISIKNIIREWMLVSVQHHTLQTETVENVLPHSTNKLKTKTQIQT